MPLLPLPPRTWEVACFRCGALTSVTFRPREDALVYCPACLDEVFGLYRRARGVAGDGPDGDGAAPAEAG